MLWRFLRRAVRCSSGRRSSRRGVKRNTKNPELSNPMTTANCPGNGELDFRLIFGEDGQQQPLCPAGQFFIFFISSGELGVNLWHSNAEVTLNLTELYITNRRLNLALRLDIARVHVRVCACSSCKRGTDPNTSVFFRVYFYFFIFKYHAFYRGWRLWSTAAAVISLACYQVSTSAMLLPCASSLGTRLLKLLLQMCVCDGYSSSTVNVDKFDTWMVEGRREAFFQCH